ncbi:MAG: hypothetical protein ACP5G2_06500 [Candidatus Bipolaricaulaceae bacterium]
MSRYLWALVAAALCLGGLVSGQTMEQVLDQTGLDADLVAMLTVDGPGGKVLFVCVYIDERALSSRIRPGVAELIAPYVGENALLIWAYSEGGATFNPGELAISQGDVQLGLSSDNVVLVEGNLLSGRLEPMTPAAAVVLLGDAIDPGAGFHVQYGSTAMATLTVDVTEAVAQAEAQASAQAEANAEAQVEAEAEVQALQPEPTPGEPCESCGEVVDPCCNPCNWLAGWWTSCCEAEPCAGACDCDPCDPCQGGFIAPLLLLLLLGL